MARTPEERAELFETLINSEKVEDRALAITHLQEELNEETEARANAETSFTQMQENYNTTNETLRQMLNTQTQQNIAQAQQQQQQQQQPNSNQQQFNQPEKRGFDLLRG